MLREWCRPTHPGKVPVAPGFLPLGKVSQAKLQLKGCRATGGVRSYTVGLDLVTNKFGD